MVATPLNTAVRFPNLGNYKFYWVPTIASLTSPTRAELDAGTDLSGEVSSVTGFEVDRDTIQVPDIDSGFIGLLPGRYTAAASSLVVYLDEAARATGGTSDIRSLLHPGDDGFIVRFDIGDIPTSFMDVFPVTVNSMAKDTNDANPAQVTVNFVITAKPAENVTVPAAS